MHEQQGNYAAWYAIAASENAIQLWGTQLNVLALVSILLRHIHDLLKLLIHHNWDDRFTLGLRRCSEATSQHRMDTHE